MKTKIVSDNNSFAKQHSKRYKNQAGFLVLPECVIARSGILEYADVQDEEGSNICDGQLITVYRPPEALKACARQFANLPLTLTHPDTNAVDPVNATSVTVGSLGSDPQYEVRDGEGFIICDIIVYDENAISAIESGDYEELSAGYETAFRRKSGTYRDGTPYQAEQFYLSPNHVALVERGRCGSECRICDHAETNNNRSQKMAKKANVTKKVRDAKPYRYLLRFGDSDETIEITEQQAKALQDEDPAIEVEEINEEDLEEEVSMPGVEPAEEFEDIDIEVEDEDAEEFEDIDIEVEDEDAEDEEEEVKDEDETLIYEVQFDDGTTGRMDENTYKHVQRYMEVTKKGDSADSVASFAKLSSQATRILGDGFDMADYVRGSVIDTAALKKDCIKKVMPTLVTRNLKGDALDRVFDTAVASAKKNRRDWASDMASLVASRKADSQVESSPVSVARANYLKRQKKA